MREQAGGLFALLPLTAVPLLSLRKRVLQARPLLPKCLGAAHVALQRLPLRLALVIAVDQIQQRACTYWSGCLCSRKGPQEPMGACTRPNAA